MKTVNHKFKVGDVVKFKDKFHSPTCGLIGRGGTTAKITGIAPSYNNRPYYYLNNTTCGAYKESCFVGLASEASKNSLCRDEAVGADTLQGPETKFDTGASDEPLDEDRCRELYLKALKKTYGKVPFESETVEVGSLLEFTEAILKATKEA